MDAFTLKFNQRLQHACLFPEQGYLSLPVSPVLTIPLYNLKHQRLAGPPGTCLPLSSSFSPCHSASVDGETLKATFAAAKEKMDRVESERVRGERRASATGLPLPHRSASSFPPAGDLEDAAEGIHL
ncbi:unnamed protein product [Caretta caretta]